jgi:hypothetical protein
MRRKSAINNYALGEFISSKAGTDREIIFF